MRVRNFCSWLVLVFVQSASFNGVAQNAATMDIALVDMEHLVQQVDEYLKEQYDHASAQVEIQVRRVDPRLRLTLCNLPLEFSIRDTGSRGGNISVHTRCEGASPWALYIPAEVKILESIIVSSRNIPKGTVLSLADLDTQLRDTSTVANNYVADAERLLGKAAARTIRAGEPLRFSLVIEPIAIKRGDTVVVEAQTGAITVSTQAVALANGRVGEQINVRNLQSERVVRIEIMGPGRGRVIL